jgi:neutral ceramidase
LIGSNHLTKILKGLSVRADGVLVFEAPSLEPDALGGGFSALLESLRSFLAPGLLVVPTSTPLQGRPKPTFDPHLAPSEAGPFSEFFRQQPGVLRSHSPTHSLAALGKDAQTLLASHRSAYGRPSPWGDGAFGKLSPWDELYKRDAWWVLIDDAWDQSCFFDYLSAVFSEKKSGITKVTPFVRFDPVTLSEHFRDAGLLREAKWGGHRVTAFRMGQAVDAGLTMMEDRPLELGPDGETRSWLDTVDRIRESGYLQVGVAKRVITPPLPCARWDGKPLDTVYRDLYCRAVVASDNDSSVALVLCDLLGLRRELVQEIRLKACESTGIPVHAIQIACTHAHSTPDTVAAGFEDESYLRTLVGEVVASIREAARRKEPARMGWSRVPIRGLATSRRIRLKDGKVFTTRFGVPSTWRVNPELVAGSGSIDKDLTVIRFETLEGKILAAISNFACHASVALSSRRVSGDFIGESMIGLERLLGDPAIVLCTNGAAADVDPTLEMPFWGPRDETSALRLGNIFAGQVLECLERTEVRDETTVGAVRRPVDLPTRPGWIRLLVEERDRMSQEFAGSAGLSATLLSVVAEEVMHTEVQAVRLGDLILVGLPGEVFAETALKLKSRLMPKNLAVVQLANDDIGYLPPKEAFEEGGYEVEDHFWGRITPDGEGILVTEAIAAVRELSSEQRPTHPPLSRQQYRQRAAVGRTTPDSSRRGKIGA